MGVPTYQELMLPVLYAAKQGERSVADVVKEIGSKLNLSDEDLEELLPSGKQSRFANRVHWAKTYLSQAGLLTSKGRGVFVATELGQKVLADQPDKIDNLFLQQFEGYRAFTTRTKSPNSNSDDSAQTVLSDEQTPDEELIAAHQEIERGLASDLLDRLRGVSPSYFESVIVELLLSMGYGGANEDVGRTIGKSGDRGVDGVIDQDALGVDQIYIQAKRYAETNTVGASDIRDFFGALNIQKASKGIFFTTSKFSSDATRTADDLSSRIVLIDGNKLASLMIKYSVGCKTQKTLVLKEIDNAFFEED